MHQMMSLKRCGSDTVSCILREQHKRAGPGVSTPSSLVQSDLRLTSSMCASTRLLFTAISHPSTHCVWYPALSLQRARPSFSFTSKCTLNKYHYKRKKKKKQLWKSQYSAVKLATRYFKFWADYPALPFCFVEFYFHMCHENPSHSVP